MTNERYTPAIKELPVDERPREKLIKYGAESLSNAELLAIILRVGTQEYSAIGLAEHILAKFGGIRGMASASIEQLSSIHGLGQAKSAQIKAMVEFGKRMALASRDARVAIRNPQDAVDCVMPILRDEPKENFMALFLNTKNEVLRSKVITVGTLDSSLITPRELFREAITMNSASVIIAHNHPSGDPTPSRDDISVTKRLSQTGELIGIAVLDHLIIGDDRWVSLKDRGLM